MASVPIPGGVHVLQASDEPESASFRQLFLDDTGERPLDSLADVCSGIMAGGKTMGAGTLTSPLPGGLELRAEEHRPHAITLILADAVDTECYAVTLFRRVWPVSTAEQESLSTLIGRHSPELVSTLGTKIQWYDCILGTIHRLPCVPNAYEMTRTHVEAQYFSHTHKVLLGQTIRYIHDSLLMAFPYEWIPATEICRELEDRLDTYLSRAPELRQHETWIRDCYHHLNGEMLIQRIHGHLNYERLWLDDDHWVIGGWDGDLHLPHEERARHGSPLQDLAAVFRGLFWACGDNHAWCEKAVVSIFEGYGEPLPSLPFSLFVLDKVCAEIAGLDTPPEGSGSDPMEFLVWFRGDFMANLHRMEQSAFHRA
ncbi:hypothetical protein EAH68_09715 [Corynebacterium hylobatis]|uniref:Aminoglycoside phosphotransferase domain-containing protein n=1 Tax=Corynebacterium hylobatis TaxID=1859290 RepID=A0A3R9ZZ49_9CORY|nr:hypothetical protein [Corynebacterium hylobatis]RSZ62405.1 hypothetical protein EAH68_09715 [Corynebacterium hylobatis]